MGGFGPPSGGNSTRGKKYLQAAQNVKLSKRSMQPAKHDHSDLFAIQFSRKEPKRQRMVEEDEGQQQQADEKTPAAPRWAPNPLGALHGFDSPSKPACRPLVMPPAPPRAAANFSVLGRPALRDPTITSIAARRQTGLPAGMLNLGNTCYLNAVLQALFSLPSFVADLQALAPRLANTCSSMGGATEAAAAAKLGSSEKQQQQQLALPPNGVCAGLLQCLSSKDELAAGGSGMATALSRAERNYIVPACLKAAVEARSAAFVGTLQHDAHEFLCSLLAGVQDEVLAGEAAHQGRRQVRISETADPVARSLGLAIEHELACSACGARSTVVEEYTHLSLELPEAPNCSVPKDVSDLLSLYFREEMVDKACEACGAAAVHHTLRHRLRRLPRVLALHLKRFRVAPVGPGGALTCQKLHTPVGLSDVLRLGPYLAECVRPPLPPPLLAAGKENQACTANRAMVGAGPDAPPAQRQQQKPGHGLRPQLGASFYSSGSGGGWGGASPLAAVGSELLSPLGSLPRSPGLGSSGGGFLRTKRATSLFNGIDGAQEERDLERALELSLAEERQRQQQQQQQETPAGGLEALGATMAAATDADDEQLQRALALSLAEQRQREQQQQQQAPGVTVVDLSCEALAEPLSGSPATPLDAALAVLPAGAGSGKVEGSGAAWTAVPSLPLGPTYEIVEDDWQPPAGDGAGDGDDGSRAKVQLPAAGPAAPEVLGLACSASAICGRAIYSLQAVVTHRGGSAAAGHFIADTRDSASCAWFRHDDSVVTRISQKDATRGAVAERGAYLLFYMVK